MLYLDHTGGIHWSKLTDKQKEQVRQWYGRPMVKAEEEGWYHFKDGRVVYST